MEFAEPSAVYVARSRRGAPLSTAARRRSLFFRPLALVLSFLLLRIPLLAPSGLVQPAFAAVDPCSPSANRILQDICPDGTPDGILIKFEQDTVDDWLTAHRMPLSNAALIYQHGRSDLRSQIRAAMYARILAIIDKSEKDRTLEEEYLFLWFRQLVQDKEVGLFQHAVDERNRWEKDACGWRPDPQIAEAYGLHYLDGGLACTGGFGALLKAQAQVPAKSYFLAAGFKESYASKILASPGGPEALKLTTGSIVAIVGVTFVVPLALGSAVALPLAAGALIHQISAVGALATQFGLWAAGVAAVVGAVLIVVLMVVVGVVAAFQLAAEQQTLDELAELDTELANAQSRFVDLPALAEPNNKEGIGKMDMTLVAATLPEFSSTSSLPGPGVDDPLFLLGSPPTTVRQSISYRDWEGNSWTVQRPHLGFFVQQGPVSSFSPALRIVDPQTGERRTVDLVGNNFVVTRAEPAEDQTPCRMDPLTGQSDASDLSKCSAWAVAAIDLLDGNGNPQTVTMAVLPSFTSRPTATFSNGVAKTFQVTATGPPLPTIVRGAGNLPPGFSFVSTPNSGMASLVYDGTTPIGAAQYSVQFVATNARGMATQDFTLRTGTDVAITSSASPHFVAAKFGSFLVTTSGNPTPTISLAPLCALNLSPLSLTDNHDGTATFSGTWPDGPLAAAIDCNPGFLANGVQRVSQEIFVYIDPAPSAKLVSLNSTTFFAAAPFTLLNTFEVITQGAETPVTISLRCTRPSWVGLTDHGDGTATLFGTPPLGTDGAFSFRVDVSTAGEAGHTIDCSHPNFTINVSNLPTFLTSNQVTFGPPGTGTVLSITTNQASGLVSLEGQLPEGLSFDPTPTHGSAIIQGIPAVGTGGIYPLVLSMTNAVGTGVQHLRLIVKEAPTFAGAPDSAVFFVGRDKRVAVQTTGFPKLPELIGNQNPVEQAMHITLSGALPPGMSFTDTNPFDVPTGTGLFSGRPNRLGVYPLTLTADNGVLPAATLGFTLHVVYPCPDSIGAGCAAGFAKGVFLVDERVAGKEKLVAKMLKGPALMQTDLGNPLDAGQGGTGTAYSLCVYDGAGDLVFGRRGPADVVVDRAGDVCAGKPCWKAVGNAPNDPRGPGTGYKYKDPASASDGVFQLVYKGGDTGKSQVTLTGNGSGLPSGIPAALQSSSQVTVQLRSSDGICLSVDLSDIKKHERSLFKAQ
jgi:hypothetical protein